MALINVHTYRYIAFQDPLRRSSMATQAVLDAVSV
jgi:hypothetical protein